MNELNRAQLSNTLWRTLSSAFPDFCPAPNPQSSSICWLQWWNWWKMARRQSRPHQPGGWALYNISTWDAPQPLFHLYCITSRGIFCQVTVAMVTWTKDRTQHRTLLHQTYDTYYAHISFNGLQIFKQNSLNLLNQNVAFKMRVFISKR